MRTTLHATLLDETAVATLADELAAMGIANYTVQAFRPQGCQSGFVEEHGSPAPVLPAGLGRKFARFTTRGVP